MNLRRIISLLYYHPIMEKHTCINLTTKVLFLSFLHTFIKKTLILLFSLVENLDKQQALPNSQLLISREDPTHWRGNRTVSRLNG